MDVEADFARCGECPLVDQPFVPGHGPTQTDLVVIGQAPGDQEIKQGKPFVGPAGVVLKDALCEVGVDPSKIHFTNTVLCHPGKNERTKRDEKPPATTLEACKGRLKREIESTGAKWILAVGAVAARGVTGSQVVLSESRCSVLRRPLNPVGLGGDALVGITHHPSASILRALLLADIRALLSFRYNGRAPDVHGELGGPGRRVRIEIRGFTPSTRRAGSRWRQVIADRVRELYPETPFCLSADTTFALDVEFRVLAHRLYIQPHQPVPPDLDNLVKPVLDTLFTSDNVLGPHGVLVNANDTYVTDVTMRKRGVSEPEQEGMDVEVRWWDAGVAQPPSDRPR